MTIEIQRVTVEININICLWKYNPNAGIICRRILQYTYAEVLTHFINKFVYTKCS